ncbi:MAG: carboxypeptidase-like regulatory domain-containing protein [Bacteroidales bacterium]|nr:carboxypeptidase-like regulatory domain-containing protein [Bacteroidales bacterium]
MWERGAHNRRRAFSGLLKGGLLLAVGLFGVCSVLYAADSGKRERVIQFSGVLVDAKDLSPLPYATIQIEGTNRGAISNINGFFTFAAMIGDRIVITSVGYRPVTLYLSDTLTEDRYSVVQSMVQDTIMLTETVIYPWPSKEKFREAFVNLELPETNADILRKNFTLAAMRELAKAGKMDAGMNYQDLTRQQVDKLYYQGQIAPNNLFNPFAWAKFIQRWKAQRQQDQKERRSGDFEEYGSEVGEY